MPVPPTSDLLATITMFEQQIKAEPMGFYSTCPPPPQMGQPLPPRSVEQANEQTVIALQDDKDNNSMQPQSLIVVSVEKFCCNLAPLMWLQCCLITFFLYHTLCSLNHQIHRYLMYRTLQSLNWPNLALMGCHILCLDNPIHLLERIHRAVNRKHAKYVGKCFHRLVVTTFIWNYIRGQNPSNARLVCFIQWQKVLNYREIVL